MKTKILSLTILTALIVLSGCKTAPGPMTIAAVTLTVAGGTRLGTAQFPQAIPEVRIAETVICAASNSTNVQPEKIVELLEAAGIKNEWVVFFLNTAVIPLYETIFDSYGKDWLANQAGLRGYLGAICEGLTKGLPLDQSTARSRALARKQEKLPHHLKWK